MNGWSGGHWWGRVNDRSIGADDEIDMEFCQVVEPPRDDSEESLEYVWVIDGQDVNIEIGNVRRGEGSTDEFCGVDKMGAEAECLQSWESTFLESR